MTQKNLIVEIIYNSQEKFNFDAKSPNISEFVSWVVSNEYYVSDKYECNTEIDKFDKLGFTNIIQSFISRFEEQMILERLDYEKAIDSLQKDPDPTEF